MKRTLDDRLSPGYEYDAVPADEGGSVVRYPDLPGCFAQVEEGEDIPQAARDVLTEWLTLAIEDGDDIPVPQAAREYSGRFVLRVPRSMHASLAMAADREGVSTNTYIVSLLAERHATRS